MLSYAGTLIADLNAQQSAFLRYWLPPEKLNDLSRPSWPGRNLTGLAFPFLDRERLPQINSLFWPVGASRWAVAYVICTDAELAAIRKAVYPNSAVSGTNASLSSAAVSAPGQGYAIGSTLTFAGLAGGNAPISQASAVVSNISSTGGVTAAALQSQGIYATNNSLAGNPPGTPSVLSTTSSQGSGATFTPSFTPNPSGVTGLVNAAVSDGGTGYVVGDELTLAGTISPVTFSAPARLIVTSVTTGGVVAAVSVLYNGVYFATPVNPVSTTGGTGTGCTLNCVFATQFIPAPFIFADGVRSRSAALYMLPPRPISQCFNTPNGVPLGVPLPTWANGLWLLTLVDDRYHWWERADDIEVPSCPQIFGIANVSSGGGGSGYVVGDTLTLVGGTFSTAATVQVASVDGSGAVTGITITNSGCYTVIPADPVSTTGGTGSGATLNGTLGTVGLTSATVPVTTGAGGTNYVVGDQLTLVGGTFTTAARVFVSSLAAGGAVATVSVLFQGVYTTPPVNPISTTGGMGTGCTLTGVFIGFWLNPWEQMVAKIARTLGVTITYPLNIPNSYLNPGAALTNLYDQTPLLLDSVAYSVGLRVVRGLNGSVMLQSASGAASSWQSQFLALKDAGGNVLLDGTQATNDTPALIPKSVQVAFGITKDTYPGCPPYLSIVDVKSMQLPTLPPLLLPGMGLTAATIGAGGTGYTVGDQLTIVGGAFTQAAKVQVATVSSGAVLTVNVTVPGSYTTPPINAAATSGGTGSGCTLNCTFSGFLPCQYIDNRYFHSTAVPAYDATGKLTNQVELDTLAAQLAYDWVSWQLAPLDVVFTGALPWTPEGMHDLLWEYLPGVMCLRVCRGPWNEWTQELIHAGEYGSNFYAQISAVVQVDSTVPVGALYPGSITAYDPATNTFTEQQPCWILDLSGGFPVVVAFANLTAQTAALASVVAYTPAALGTYRISGYLNPTAISTDVIAMQVTYTDENGASKTLTLVPPGATTGNIGSTGDFPLAPATIRCNPSPITILTTLTTTGGSITYDVGGIIEQMN